MKNIMSLILAFLLCLSLCACGQLHQNNMIADSESMDTIKEQSSFLDIKKDNYPRMDEIDYYFVNGVSYGEPVALLGYTNNSKFTIVRIDFEFVVASDITEEHLSLFEVFELGDDELSNLTLDVRDYMVCDPSETVVGANCYLFGNYEATNVEQCNLFSLNRATITYLGEDEQLHTVAYSEENKGYSLEDSTQIPYVWSDSEYATIIPSPDTRFLEVDYDKEDYFEFTAYDFKMEKKFSAIALS